MAAAAMDRPFLDRRDHDGQAGWDARREDPHESAATNQVSWDNEVVPTLRKRLEAESQYLTSRLSNEFPTTGSSSASPSSSHSISKIPLPAHRAKRKGSLTSPVSHMLLTDEREPMPPPMAVTTNGGSSASGGRARVHSTPFAFHQPFGNKAPFHPSPALPSDQQQQQQLKDSSSLSAFPSKGVGRNYASQISRIPAPRTTASSAGGSPSRGYLYPLTTAASRAGSSSSSHSSSDHSHMSNYSSTALPPPKTIPTDPYYPGSLTADEAEAVRSDRMIRDEVAPFKILSPDLQPGRIDQFTEQELLKQLPVEATSVIRRREMLKIARHGHEPTENETGEGGGVLGARSQQQHEQQMSAPSELKRADLTASPSLRVRAASLSRKKPHTPAAVVTPPAAAVTVASNTSTPTRASGSVSSQSGASLSPANARTSSSGARTLQNKAHSTSTLSARSRKNSPGPSASMVKSRSDNTGFGGPPSLYPTLQEFGSIRESMLNENEIPPESMEPPTSAELRNWDEVVLPTVRKNQKSNFLLDDWTEEDHAVSPARSAKARRLERQKQQYAAFEEGDVLATAPAREGVAGQTQAPTTHPTLTKDEPIELIRLAPPAEAGDDQRPGTVDIKPPGSPAPFSNSWDRSRDAFTPALRSTPASPAAYRPSPSDQENGKATQTKPPKEKSRGCCIVM